MLEAIRYVDLVIPENDWEQKRNDVLEYKIDVVVMGSDWVNNEKFECLKDLCEIKYLLISILESSIIFIYKFSLSALFC